MERGGTGYACIHVHTRHYYIYYFEGGVPILEGGVYGDLISGGARAHSREDARTICPEQLASDIMADDVYLLYAYNVGNNVCIIYIRACEKRVMYVKRKMYIKIASFRGQWDIGRGRGRVRVRGRQCGSQGVARGLVVVVVVHCSFSRGDYCARPEGSVGGPMKYFCR